MQCLNLPMTILVDRKGNYTSILLLNFEISPNLRYYLEYHLSDLGILGTGQNSPEFGQI